MNTIEMAVILAIGITVGLMFYYIVYSTEPKPKSKPIWEDNNWPGVPPPNLTTNEVKNKCSVQFMCVPLPRTHCPKCCKELKQYQSDWRDFFESKLDGYGGQYDVCGTYCEDGHYTHLNTA